MHWACFLLYYLPHLGRLVPHFGSKDVVLVWLWLVGSSLVHLSSGGRGGDAQDEEQPQETPRSRTSIPLPPPTAEKTRNAYTIHAGGLVVL